MQNVILALHILACVAMTVVVLLQRSEGGALGIGGGSGSVFSGRGAAGALVRTTMIIGGIFFLTSLVLTTMASRDPNRSGVEAAVEGGAAPGGPTDLLDPDTNLLDDPLLASPTDPLAEDTEGPAPEPEAVAPADVSAEPNDDPFAAAHEDAEDRP